MIKLSIDSAGMLLREFHGAVSAEELLATWRQMIGSPDYDPSRNVIMDFSQAERLDFSYPALCAVDAIMNRVDRRKVPQRVAIVAPTEEYFGVARMYAMVRSRGHREFEVVPDRESAIAWLKKGNEPP